MPQRALSGKGEGGEVEVGGRNLTHPRINGHSQDRRLCCQVASQHAGRGEAHPGACRAGAPPCSQVRAAPPCRGKLGKRGLLTRRVPSRANDFAAWEEMVLSERNERAVYLVTQTNKFLDDLIGRVRA